MNTGKFLGCGCTAYFIGLLLASLPGWWGINFLTNAVFCKDVPWYYDWLAGLFLSPFTLLPAVFIWFLRLCGVDVSWGC